MIARPGYRLTSRKGFLGLKGMKQEPTERPGGRMRILTVKGQILGIERTAIDIFVSGIRGTNRLASSARSRAMERQANTLRACLKLSRYAIPRNITLSVAVPPPPTELLGSIAIHQPGKLSDVAYVSGVLLGLQCQLRHSSIRPSRARANVNPDPSTLAPIWFGLASAKIWNFSTRLSPPTPHISRGSSPANLQRRQQSPPSPWRQRS
jgi:hypothetical protein